MSRRPAVRGSERVVRKPRLGQVAVREPDGPAASQVVTEEEARRHEFVRGAARSGEMLVVMGCRGEEDGYLGPGVPGWSRAGGCGRTADPDRVGGRDHRPGNLLPAAGRGQ